MYFWVIKLKGCFKICTTKCNYFQILLRQQQQLAEMQKQKEQLEAQLADERKRKEQEMADRLKQQEVCDGVCGQ